MAEWASDACGGRVAVDVVVDGGNLKVGITQVSIAVEGFDQRVSDKELCVAMKLCRVIVKVACGYFYKLAIDDADWSACLAIVD
jgi:hypothetical protein